MRPKGTGVQGLHDGSGMASMFCIHFKSIEKFCVTAISEIDKPDFVGIRFCKLYGCICCLCTILEFGSQSRLLF
jgi:hypothetical protein